MRLVPRTLRGIQGFGTQPANNSEKKEGEATRPIWGRGVSSLSDLMPWLAGGALRILGACEQRRKFRQGRKENGQEGQW